MGQRTDIALQERIDRYLEGRLGPTEAKAFEREMAQDAGLARQTDLTRLANDAVFDAGLLELKAKMKNLGQTHKTLKKTGNNRLITLTTVASIAVSALLVLIVDNHQPKKPQAPAREIPAVPHAVIGDKVLPGEPEEEHTPADVAEEVKKPEQNQIQYVQDSGIREENQLQPDKIEKDGTKREEERSLKADEEKQPETVRPQEKSRTGENNAFPDSPEKPGTAKEEANTAQEHNAAGEEQNCEGVTIHAFIDTWPGCDNPPSGKLQIDTKTLTGGIAPYSYAIENPSGWQDNASFENLVPGAYTVYLRDKNGCTSAIQGNYVDRKDCGQEYTKRFSPPQETWGIPVKEGQQGDLRIYNRQNQLIYQAKAGRGYENEWDGRDLNQGQLPAGLYLFIIRYPDGSIQKGQVTIIR